MSWIERIFSSIFVMCSKSVTLCPFVSFWRLLPGKREHPGLKTSHRGVRALGSSEPSAVTPITLQEQFFFFLTNRTGHGIATFLPSSYFSSSSGFEVGDLALQKCYNSVDGWVARFCFAPKLPPLPAAASFFFPHCHFLLSECARQPWHGGSSWMMLVVQHYIVFVGFRFWDQCCSTVRDSVSAR